MSERFRRLRERFPMVALGVEVFSIVLGVLLALGVNEWREARAEDELAERALAQIADEVDRSRQVVAERHPYHSAALDSLQSYAEDLDPQLGVDDVSRARLGFPRGGRFAPLFSSAYEAARASGALAYVDYETLGLLSSIYEMQKTLTEQDDRVVELLFSPVNLQPGKFYYTLSLVPGLMRDVVNSEETLLDLYDRFPEMVEG
ncbi:MAG: hypothetical protein ACODAA_01020 [Gemmatimonadota bacterium]